ncbi:MAG: phosphopantothenate/pantothenate synthetase family protein, partial [Thermoplasmata archaeon]|nr:phosphopantothenate/pantothenate synthetase family protein [Thermoplasmata archaeon]
KVISIDLNPLSRTSLASDLPIVDELRRALAGIRESALARPRGIVAGRFPPFDGPRALSEARRAMARGLSRA